MKYCDITKYCPALHVWMVICLQLHYATRVHVFQILILVRVKL